MTRRGYLTKREYDALLKAQGGLCAVWGCTSEGPFDADHSTPNALLAGKPDQLLCRACHRAKTKRDVASIAKVKRIANKRTQHDKRKLRGPLIRSARKLVSRGFDKLLRKKMDGSVEPRR